MDLSNVSEKETQVTRPGIDPGTFRLVAQRPNHYATLGGGPQSAKLKKMRVEVLIDSCLVIWGEKNPSNLG